MLSVKFANVAEAEEFFKVVDHCKGKVELISGEGDRLNIKSKLNQYVSLVKFFSKEEVKQLEVIAKEPEDMEKLTDFIMNR